LKIAEKLSHRIITAAKESLRIKSKKIIETGHGININMFKTERDWLSSKLRILSVGRISPIKNYETLLKASKILKDTGVNFSLKIVGQPVMVKDHQYFKFLESLKEELGLNDLVEFTGFISHNKIPGYYKEADMIIGLTPRGGIDKTILEGMASGCLALTSNNVFGNYFGRYSDQLLFNYGDAKNLAEKIMRINKSSLDSKKEVSNFMIESVIHHHKLEDTISQTSSLL